MDNDIAVLVGEPLEEQSGKSSAATEEGLHGAIKPFMEQNGYTDSAGWWVKNDM